MLSVLIIPVDYVLVSASLLLQVFAHWANQFGPIYKCSIGPGDVLVITDPEEVLKLSSREMDIPKDYLAYRGLNPVRQLLKHCASSCQILKLHCSCASNPSLHMCN